MAGYVLPFALFIGFLAIRSALNLPPKVEFAVRAVVIGCAILVFSRHLLSWKFAFWARSFGLGLLVFAIWVAPDLLFPAWHQLWPFHNAVTGNLSSSIPQAHRTDLVLIGLRCFQAIILVPIAEELFWRGFLLRWLVDKEFENVAFGTYTASSFWICAVLFGSEHGALWDVGLLAGILYNWWAFRTRNLADCILAHAVTNAALCAFVLAANRWEYWS